MRRPGKEGSGGGVESRGGATHPVLGRPNHPSANQLPLWCQMLLTVDAPGFPLASVCVVDRYSGHRSRTAALNPKLRTVTAVISRPAPPEFESKPSHSHHLARPHAADVRFGRPASRSSHCPRRLRPRDASGAASTVVSCQAPKGARLPACNNTATSRVAFPSD